MYLTVTKGDDDDTRASHLDWRSPVTGPMAYLDCLLLSHPQLPVRTYA